MSRLFIPRKTGPLSAVKLLRVCSSLCPLIFIFLLASCAVQVQPDVSSNFSEWRLAADMDSGEPATLSHGMSKEEVTALLGTPYRIWKHKGNESHIITWTYRRIVEGPSKPFTVRSGDRLIRGMQTIRYADTVVIVFSDNALQSADVSRETVRSGPGI